MNSNLLQRANEIYRAAMKVSEEQRNFFIWENCGNDNDLYNEVQLLIAMQRGNSVSDSKTVDFNSMDFKTNVSTLPQTEYTTQRFIGQVIDGRYHIERKLDSGGMGDVYLAMDKPEMYSRKVVVKVLKETAFQNEYTLKKFKQEIEALTRLDGVQGAVGIIDAGTLPSNEPYLVMRYVEGESLRHYIKPEVGMAFEDVAKIIKQIGNTLTESHNRGVYHRDLKPENIIVERVAFTDFKVTIIDFGIARVLESAVDNTTVVDTVAGTIRYISPEQISKNPVKAASDVYLLGIIAYEMLTGRLPFNPETPFQIFDLQRAGVQIAPKAWNPAIPDEANHAILKALSWELSKRQQSAREFGDELSSALLLQKAEQNSFTTKPNNFVAQKTTPVQVKKGISKILFVIPFTLLFFVVLIVAGVVVYKIKFQPQPKPSGEIETNATKRQITFWLTVRMCKDSVNWCKDESTAVFGNPLKSTGEQIFSNGTRMSFHALSPQSGYLYILIEGQGENSTTKWTAVFPNPKDNNGISRIKSNQELKTLEISADSNTGTETLWIVWSVSQIEKLENLFKTKIDKSNGAFLESSHEWLRTFFNDESTSKIQSQVTEKPSPQITLIGNETVFIVPKKIKHENY